MLSRIFHPHVPILVLVTFGLAILASFVALELAERIKVARGQARLGWLAAAGIAMGGGIWAMHFVGMIAMELPFAVAYEPSLTALSLLVAIFVSTAGLYQVFWYGGSWQRCIFGGSLMGIGVAAMHYIGMAALIIPAVEHYNLAVVVLSVCIAMAASIAALRLAFRVVHLASKLGSALLMGIAIAGMHYTGLAALRFICVGNTGGLVAGGILRSQLALGVTGTSLLILMMGLFLAVYDRRTKRRTRALYLAAESKRRIDRLLQNAADLIAIVDRNWTVMYLSPVAGPLANHARQLGVGAGLLSMFDPPAQERGVDLMQRALASQDMTMRDVFRSFEAAESWFEISLIDRSSDRAIGGIIVTLRDITQQKHAIDLVEATLKRSREQTRVAEHRERDLSHAQQETRSAEQHAIELSTAHEETRAAEAQASLMARRDALTGLPNRRIFATDLQSAIKTAQNRRRFSSLLLIDLDGFKKINDLYGHQIGDAVLYDIARRMQATLHKDDTIARLGGDEFAIISEGHADMQQHRKEAMQLADRLLKTIRQPLIFDDHRVRSGASIGIALCRAEASESAPLLHAADVALYHAKVSGGGCSRFFEQSMDDDMRAREMLEKDLIAAISEDAIQPYFQPIVDLRLNEICGFEALARWDHAKHGFIAPNVFIPIVERLGLMTDLTTSILRQACRVARQWPEKIWIGVNWSPSELKDPSLPSRILTILAEEGLAPGRLEVEITETALMSDMVAAKVALTTLKGFGISIALDDFGTGYSSLSHLQQFQFDKVKVDLSFVQAMQADASSEKIVDAILGLTRSLELKAVAEGIENSAVLARLIEKGCEFGQGYFFSKAVTGPLALELLRGPLCGNARVSVSI
jgi:diguanylate cyclase (GGDEF)-like protein